MTSKLANKVTLADWTAEGDDDDVNGFFGGEKRQRGGRKKRKKNKEETTHMVQNWDDIYDPSRPNGYDEYKNSEEKILELREWKDKLYAHRIARQRSSNADDSDGSHYSAHKGTLLPVRTGFWFWLTQLARLAPPGLSFAPPALFDDTDRPPPQPDYRPDDPTGQDAYAQRMQVTQTANQASPPPPLLSLPQAVSPPALSSQDLPKEKLPSSAIATNGILPLTISRAPVRYSLPPAPLEMPQSEAELADVLQAEEAEREGSNFEPAPRSLRPGQQGFAERLMSKYGWTKGSGLGASGAGIINPLRVQVEKQKKKPDSEGGGFVGPGGRGKIIGGKKQGAQESTGKFGAMTEVVVLYGMVDGMNLDAELEGAGDGGIMQEIGEECGEKYGMVERVFIDRTKPLEAPVFVKFTSQLSALRVRGYSHMLFRGSLTSRRLSMRLREGFSTVTESRRDSLIRGNLRTESMSRDQLHWCKTLEILALMGA